MDVTGYRGREGLSRWASGVADLLRERGDAAAAASVGRALEQFRSERFLLTVVGKMKRGKSTLINAMLGRRDDAVAPIDKLPATGTITRFSRAPAESAVVYFRDGRREEVGFARVGEYVTEEFNEGNAKGVDVVEVSGPFPSLEAGLVLVDTPGAASLHGHHDAVLNAFIPQSDAVVFLVSARMPLDQDELDLLGRVGGAQIRKIFFAVNRADECSANDLQDAVGHSRRLLALAGHRVEKVYVISGRKAFQGDLAGSGVEDLFKDVRELLTRSKGQAMCDRLVERVRQAAGPAIQAVAAELAAAGRTAEQLDADVRRLEQGRRELEQGRGKAEPEFLAAWAAAVDAFDRELTKLRPQVTRKVLAQINDCPVTGVGSLARQLPALISRAVDEALSPPARRLSEALRGLCDALRAACPDVDVSGVAEGVGVAAASSYGEMGKGLAMAAASVGLSAAAAGTTLTGLGYLLAPVVAVFGGPVAWGVGFWGLFKAADAWRLARANTLEQMASSARDEVARIFAAVRADRVEPLRGAGAAAAGQVRLRQDKALDDLEAAVRRAKESKPGAERLAALESLGARLGEAVSDAAVELALR